ncbi:MAG: hypothetical protein RL077_1410 [Verrucomicrobiota bacterium]|jgi:hypothetical protein
MKTTDYFPANLTRVAFWALTFALAGCNSHTGPRDLMLEEATKQVVERPVAMRGEATFIEGKVTALATVTRGFDRGGRGDRVGKGDRPGEGVFQEGRRRKDDDAGAFTEVYNIGGYGDSEEDQKEAMQDYIRQARARRAAGSPMPPVTLRVLFENRGTEAVELEVTEVNSELGNFAVRPPKITVAPGAKGLLEPMVSQLGVTSDEIPLKIAIRVGGKKEQQTLLIKNILAASLRKEFEQLQK